ncbi:MAG TPA: tripartite tricarboxylate transporter substrate-binding protein [Longimicrobiales bacterium]|nr:tripartite tricarboxylate transporter substrate-binding protein [Longimicrobiales bacterium]
MFTELVPRPLTLICLAPTLLLAAACGGERGGAPDGSGATADGCFPIDGQTVRWIVPTSAGGGQDMVSRLLEPFLETAIGAEIVIENRVGAGGTRGARTIRDAAADGRTLGIINATGRLVAEMSEARSGLHPLDDFTVLGRISAEDPVWMVGRESPFERVEDLWVRAGEGPIVMGISDVGGTGFVFASIAAELLGLDVRYLPGYGGGRELALGLMRSEFDVGGFSFESMRDRVESGDLVPILQLSDAAVGDHPALAGIPVLAGENGIAPRRAAARGVDVEAVVAHAQALAQLFEFGRVIVAPPALPEDLRGCLAGGLAEVAGDSVLLAAASRAQRTIRFATREQLAAELEAWSEDRDWLVPILQRHLETVRRGGSGG